MSILEQLTAAGQAAVGASCGRPPRCSPRPADGIYLRYFCYPLYTLGKGTRVGIWLTGCGRNCPGCSGEEFKRQLPEDYTPLADIIKLFNKITASSGSKIDGVTITGGEPFDQPEALLALTKWIAANITTDILVYTGYTLAQLRSLSNKAVDAALQTISVLIDGEYKIELDDHQGIRGSSNQQLHFLRTANPLASAVISAYTQGKRRQQAFALGDRVFLAGVK